MVDFADTLLRNIRIQQEASSAAYAAGMAAERDLGASSLKLRRLIERTERGVDLLVGRQGGALVEQSMIEAAIHELRAALTEARKP
jgi:hypothetical protein